MEKYKRGDIVGIERENERDEKYKSTRNPQIDKSRTHLNYHKEEANGRADREYVF